MTRYQKQRKRLLSAIVVLSMILVCLCTVAYAKYMESIAVGGGTVTISADIGTIYLQEHEAVRNAHGAYELTDEPGENKYYILMPGVDIPKDPYVTVKKTSTLEAYVFIKVDAELPDGVSFQLTDVWQAVKGKSGVYVYCQNGEPVKVVGDIESIPVLKDNKIFVSQKYQGGECQFQITAYLYQVAAGQDAAEVYGEYPNSN